MGAEYEPGTVAEVEWRALGPNRQRGRAIRGYGDWYAIRGDDAVVEQVDDKWVTDVHAQVVLDAVDVEYAATALEGSGYHGDLYCARQFRDALPRPPKPPEPTGLGAVVKDRGGVLWTRFTREYDYDAVWSHETSHRSNMRYADIDAVEVLSEGVA